MAVVINQQDGVEIRQGDRRIVIKAVVPGDGEVVSFQYNQTSPSNQWTINHNLGFLPQIQTFNSGGVEIKGEVLNVSNNQTIVNFIIPISGYARLN